MTTTLACLICLRKFQKDPLAEDDEEEEDYQRRLCTVLPVSPQGEGSKRDLYTRFLLWLQRYLKLEEMGDRFLLLGRDHLEGGGGKITAFCGDCQSLVAYLCDLYAELEGVKLHLNRKVGQREERMKGASRRISPKLLRGILQVVGKQLNTSFSRVDLFRKAVINGCRRKLQTSGPQLFLPKGLLPEEWKFTYKATRYNLMKLIIIYALGCPPQMQHQSAPPPEKKPKLLSPKKSDPSPVQRTAIKRRINTKSQKNKVKVDKKAKVPLREQAQEDVVVKKEEVTVGEVQVVEEKHVPELQYQVDDDNDGGFQDMASPPGTPGFVLIEDGEKDKSQVPEPDPLLETSSRPRRARKSVSFAHFAEWDENDDDDPDSPPDAAAADDNDSDWSGAGDGAAAGNASPSPSASSGEEELEECVPDEEECTIDLAALGPLRKRASRKKKRNGCDPEEDDELDIRIPVPRKKPGPNKPSNKLRDVPCRRCPKLFKTPGALANHMRVQHGVTLGYPCPYCGQKFKTISERDSHRKTHSYDSIKDRLPCPMCPIKFAYDRRLFAHMRMIHKCSIDFTCISCGHQSENGEQHQAHRKVAHPRVRKSRAKYPHNPRKPRKPPVHHCGRCDITFANKEEYSVHKKDNHYFQSTRSIHPFDCPVCGGRFGNSVNFQDHLGTHEGDSAVLKPHHCGVCGKSIFGKELLEEHFKGEHGGTFGCDLCGTSYHTSKFLLNHLETHETEEKRYTCNFCYRAYTHKQCWALHRKQAHVGNERIFCDEPKCPREFETVDELSEHLKSHLVQPSSSQPEPSTENPKSEPDGAPDEESSKPATSTTEEPKEIYTCTTCGWAFLRKWNLDLHSILHVPNINNGYACPYPKCDRVIVLKDKLIQHYMLIHGKDQKEKEFSLYECHECSKTYSTFILFKTHLRLHDERNSGRKFSCDTCGEECVDIIALNKHQQSHGKVGHGRKKRSRMEMISDRESLGKKISERKEVIRLRKATELEKKWGKNPKCQACNFVCARSTTEILSHLRTQHEDHATPEEKVHQCHFCHLKFKWAQTLAAHGIDAHLFQQDRYDCDAAGCDLFFETCEQLTAHLKEVHLLVPAEDPLAQLPSEGVTKVDEILQCPTCSWQFTASDYLDLHQLNHTAPMGDVYPCPDCEATFATLLGMKSHWNVEHGHNLKPYSCAQCTVSFFHPYRLFHHERRHERKKAAEGQLWCEECQKEFLCPLKFDIHMKAHDPRNHILCPEGCGQVLRNQTLLRDHLRKVHGEGERYTCHLCGQSYRQAYLLQNHIDWGHGPPKFECDICGKKYKRPSGLFCHKKTHLVNEKTGESGLTYTCTICGNTYRSPEGLKYHVASLHTPAEGKKYACAHCPYTTHRRMLIKTHLRSCLKKHGLPWDEEKWGKEPAAPTWNPARNKTNIRRPRRRKRSSSEEEEESEAEEQPERAPPILFPQQPTTSSASNVQISAALANITGIPTFASGAQQQAAPKRGRGRPKRASNVGSSQQQSTLMMATNPQLFSGNSQASSTSTSSTLGGWVDVGAYGQETKAMMGGGVKPEYDSYSPQILPQQMGYSSLNQPPQHPPGDYSSSSPLLSQQVAQHGLQYNTNVSRK